MAALDFFLLGLVQVSGRGVFFVPSTLFAVFFCEDVLTLVPVVVVVVVVFFFFSLVLRFWGLVVAQ